MIAAIFAGAVLVLVVALGVGFFILPADSPFNDALAEAEQAASGRCPEVESAFLGSE